MKSIEHNTIASSEAENRVADKEELIAYFNQLSDETKARFYKDCKEGISAEQSRQNTLNFVRQLWKK